MRLIDADAFDKMLIEAQAENGGNFRFGVLGEVRGNLALFPTADCPEIVRCKDCRYGQYCTDGETTYQCFKWNSNEFGALHEQDWFCADGERRLEEKQPEYPCINCCSPSERAACCGCPKERQWQEKYGNKK